MTQRISARLVIMTGCLVSLWVSTAAAEPPKLPEIKDPEATHESLVAAAAKVYWETERALEQGEPITPPFIAVCVDASKQLYFADRDLARRGKKPEAEKSALRRYLERVRAIHQRVDTDFRAGKTASEIPLAMTAHAVAEAELWVKRQEEAAQNHEKKVDLRPEQSVIIDKARRTVALMERQQDVGEPITLPFIELKLRFLRILCQAERDLARMSNDLLAERAAIVRHVGRVREAYQVSQRRLMSGWDAAINPMLIPPRELIAAKLMLEEFVEDHSLPQLQAAD